MPLKTCGQPTGINTVKLASMNVILALTSQHSSKGHVMSKNSAHQSLSALQQEISQLDINDPAVKARVDQLLADIEQQVDNPENQDQHQTLTDQLNLAIEQFEVEHPQLTGILNRVMVALGNMGI